MVGSHCFLPGLLVHYRFGDIMKNYHAVGIAICAAVIITCALSLTDTVHAAVGVNGAVASTIMGASEVKVPVQPAVRPSVCPTPTQDNSGYVATDEDGDGKPDTIWHVYISGLCNGFTVGADDHGTPYTN